MNIFVGNLPQEISEGDLKDFFAQYGQVAQVTLVGTPHSPISPSRRRSQYTNQDTRRYAYVEMPDWKEAQAAVEGANAQEVQGQAITVLQALPLEKKKAKAV